MKRTASALGIALTTTVAWTVPALSPMVLAEPAGPATPPSPECVRGTFNDYHEPETTEIAPQYQGNTFVLSQDYPTDQPAPSTYPWSDLDVDDLTSGDTAAEYLDAVFDYVTEGNLTEPDSTPAPGQPELDWLPENNQIRTWFHAPWLDATKDGREYVRGLTHEHDAKLSLFDPSVGSDSDTTYQSWAVGAYNAPGGWAIGQVWCDPTAPRPEAINPDPAQANAFPDGTVVWKLLFSTADPVLLPYLRDSVEWQANIYTEPRTDDLTRSLGIVRLVQIDVAVRDDRLPYGWAFGTLAYNADAAGESAWDRLVPIGLQWGNDPGVVPAVPPSATPLQESWINTSPDASELLDNHLGWGHRLDGPLDNPNSSCMSCHQTAGLPAVPVVPPDDATDRVRLEWFVNTPAGVAFGAAGRVSTDYSLQTSLGLQRFLQSTCDPAVVDERHSSRGDHVVAPREVAAQSCGELASLLAETAQGSSTASGSASPSWWNWAWAFAVVVALLIGALLLPFDIFSRRSATDSPADAGP